MRACPQTHAVVTIASPLGAGVGTWGGVDGTGAVENPVQISS